MIVLIVIAVVVVLAVLGLVASRLYFGNTAAVDRVRIVDERAAAKIELQRAEEAVRGAGQVFGGFGGI